MKLKNAEYAASVRAGKADALVVVDIQNDFLPGGALAVEGGDGIIPGINGIINDFFLRGNTVVLTQDWHPPGHLSFASAHPGKKPYDPYAGEGIGPVLWPDHCVQGTPGAGFHRDFRVEHAHAVIRKGCRPAVDSYSGFVENDHRTETGLDGYLRGRGVERIFLCGLALDYCVFYTASDGADRGYGIFVIADLTRAVGSPPESVEQAVSTMVGKGVVFMESPALTL
ncbi:MAG TPA: bifunctional nicotinamidase/pyrazinamidase [Spirochaetes bacterium]|nr:bifunctional nicotinamidase/pyrazinamidase [Spirochaetota bacterium]